MVVLASSGGFCDGVAMIKGWRFRWLEMAITMALTSIRDAMMALDWERERWEDDEEGKMVCGGNISSYGIMRRGVGERNTWKKDKIMIVIWILYKINK